MKSAPHMGYDAEGVRRVARTLLRHVRPADRQMAMAILSSRLGSYVSDKAVLWAEIDNYFGQVPERRVA